MRFEAVLSGPWRTLADPRPLFLWEFFARSVDFSLVLVVAWPSFLPTFSVIAGRTAASHHLTRSPRPPRSGPVRVDLADGRRRHGRLVTGIPSDVIDNVARKSWSGMHPLSPPTRARIVAEAAKPNIPDFMRRQRQRPETPDLFSSRDTGAKPAPPHKAPPEDTGGDRTPTPFPLPRDLPASLKHLDDTQLDILSRAVRAEARRRRPRPTTTMPDRSRPGKASPPRRRAKPKPKADKPPPGLSAGQLRLIQTAFEAGVKPAAIARQFRISPTQVERIVSPLKPGRR